MGEERWCICGRCRQGPIRTASPSRWTLTATGAFETEYLTATEFYRGVGQAHPPVKFGGWPKTAAARRWVPGALPKVSQVSRVSRTVRVLSKVLRVSRVSRVGRGSRAVGFLAALAALVAGVMRAELVVTLAAMGRGKVWRWPVILQLYRVNVLVARGSLGRYCRRLGAWA
jgi:hypothetical protein